MNQGTFPLPGFTTAAYTIGHDAVQDVPGITCAAPVLSVDIETAGKSGNARYDVKAVSVGIPSHAVILDPRDTMQFGIARGLLNTGRKLIFHNSPFDVPILYLVGLIDLESLDYVTDTLIYARLAEPDERASKALGMAARRHLQLDLTDPLPQILKTLGVSRERWFSEFDLDTPNYRHMAATDAILTARLEQVVRADAYARLTQGHPFVLHGVTGDDAWALVEREQVLNRDALRRTCRGYAVDTSYADEYRRTNASRLAVQTAELEREGVVPGYSGSMISWLSERDLIPEGYPVTAKKREPSGRADDLEMIDHPLVRTFSEHKDTTKIDRDYLSKVLFDAALTGRTHPTVSFLGAATGRVSMAGPPVQQFPPDARGIIVPDDYDAVMRAGQTYYDCKDHVVTGRGTPGEKVTCNCTDLKGLVSIDWSQIEPVLAANIAGDLDTLKGYESGASDLYSDIALFAAVPRKVAKIILLAQLYGEGLLKLAHDLKLITYTEMQLIKQYSRAHDMPHRYAAEELGVEGFGKAIEIRNKVFGPLPLTFGYMSKLRQVSEEYRTIPTLSGRIVPIPSGWFDGKFSVQTHKGVNYTFQGGAYDTLANSWYKIHEAGLRDAVYLTMHDEMIVDGQAARDIRKIMETPPDRLCMLAKRTPVLRTDFAHLGERWRSV
jgi:DNA polymerase I